MSQPEGLLTYENQNDRYHALDALRGIAAMVVVLMHFHDLLFGKERRLHLSHVKLMLLYLASPLRSGASAVALFFVLSGFVLALPSLRGKQLTYFTFAIRRIIRIYLPYLAALCIAVAGDARFHGQIPRGMWQSIPWPAPPLLPDVWQHVLFVGTYNVLLFNFVFWTLVIEMRVSLAYPFLVDGLLRLRSRTAFAFTVLTLGILTVFALRYPHSDTLKSIRFGCFFVAGFFLAQQRSIIAAWFSRQPTAIRTGLMFTSLLGFGYNIALRAPAPILDLLCLFSSIGIIVLALNNDQWKQFLQSRAPQFLGQISYSLYLTHLPVLFVGYVLIGQHLSTWSFLALYLVTSIFFASLFYALVERTFLLLSRHYKRQTTKSMRISEPHTLVLSAQNRP